MQPEFELGSATVQGLSDCPITFSRKVVLGFRGTLKWSPYSWLEGHTGELGGPYARTGVSCMLGKGTGRSFWPLKRFINLSSLPALFLLL